MYKKHSTWYYLSNLSYSYFKIILPYILDKFSSKNRYLNLTGRCRNSKSRRENVRFIALCARAYFHTRGGRKVWKSGTGINVGGIICPPPPGFRYIGFFNWSPKIWGWYGTPGTYRPDMTVCLRSILCHWNFNLLPGPAGKRGYH